VIVRPELPADHAAIAEVVTAAFGRPDEARLVERIRASSGYVPELGLVAEEGGVVIGHALFSCVELAGVSTLPVLELAPLAVLPERQRRGVGSALVRAGLERAEARGEPLVLVLGHASYYPRFGFEPASRYGIVAPLPGIPEEAFMVRRLRAWREGHRGRVAWPPAFDGS
jgi:putative acetyltransferase